MEFFFSSLSIYFQDRVTVLPLSASKEGQKAVQGNLDSSWAQFHQRVYAQLLRAQIPEAQKRQSSQAAFCAFGICKPKSIGEIDILTAAAPTKREELQREVKRKKIWLS